MRVYYCVRDLSHNHSCLYNMFLIKELGYELIPILGLTTTNLNGILRSFGIKTQYFSVITDIPHWRLFLKNNLTFWRLMKKGLKDYRKDDIVFVGTADSALYSFPLFINKSFILSLLEMHENQYFLQMILRFISSRARSVVCCEINRARYAQFMWGLNRRPYVISNKPYGFNLQEDELCEQSRDVLLKIKGRKSVLYQAWHIHQIDVIQGLVEALKIVNDDIVLVIMGIVDPCVDIKAIEDIYANIIWAGHIPAPHHLEVTRHIDIGVAMYSERSLNNLFCAPNKIYEYSCFGKPILCNDIPGLVETIGINNAGVCVNWRKPDCIAAGIKHLISNYDDFSNNAKAFYEDENNIEIMRLILNNLDQ